VHINTHTHTHAHTQTNGHMYKKDKRLAAKKTERQKGRTIKTFLRLFVITTGK